MSHTTITTATVSRNDLVFEIHPDLALTKTGKVICVYRESDWHDPVDFAHIILRESIDGGRTWGRRRVLAESRGKDKQFDRLKCPRVSQLSDGRLVIICDVIHGYESARTTPVAPSLLWWSEDDGNSWSHPQSMSIRGIVPDRVRETPGGALITATEAHGETGESFVAAFRCEDGGKSWEGPFQIVTNKEYARLPHEMSVGEPSIVALADKTLVCYLRNDAPTGPGMKCFSRDDGRTWEGPYPTLMPHVRGRPAAGMLASGNVMVTYRYGRCENYFAYMESQESALCTDPAKQTGRLFPIAHQKSSDGMHFIDNELITGGGGGYTGWVQFLNGEILHVITFNRDAPKYYVEVQRFRESDI